MSEERKQCAHTRQGPKVGKNVVLWRQQCRRLADPDSKWCWQHRAEHGDPRGEA